MNKASQRTALVWTVPSKRAGESSQIRALAQALGYGFEEKKLTYRSHMGIVNLCRQVTLAGIDRPRSSALEPPWPDLVISAGLSNEPVVRWISHQSSGRSRLVHIGRTWAPIDCFDLVITTPQYRLPRQEKVLHNTTTLNSIDESVLLKAADAFRERFRSYPRPYVAVLVGGRSGPYHFGVHAARRLAKQAVSFAEQRNATLLVTSSSRTPDNAARVLATETL